MNKLFEINILDRNPKTKILSNSSKDGILGFANISLVFLHHCDNIKHHLQYNVEFTNIIVSITSTLNYSVSDVVVGGHRPHLKNPMLLIYSHDDLSH